MAITKTQQTTQLALQAAALQQLAVIGGQLTNEEDIAFEGKRFVFPSQFQGDLPGLNRFVTRYVQSQEEAVLVQQTFEYRPMDVAYATYACLRDYFGYAQGKARQGMFGSEPPQEITIPIGFVKGKLVRHTVPWGDMVLPGLREATLSISSFMDRVKGELGFLNARCRRGDKPIVDGFFRVVEQHLETNSIYRGHAVFGNMDYFDVDQVDPGRFVYDTDVWAQVETNILSPMRHAQVLESYGLSPKRVVLLEGPFGTGKSALGRTAAKVAASNGWTALLARPSEDDPFAMLQTARLYQPAMVFVEDVDVISNTQDPAYVSKLLDQFDGFGNKDVQMLLVLTTNHADRIHKGMLRPGRLDTVIHIGNMDRPGVEQLCHIIVGDKLEPDNDYDRVFEATKGFTPAFVKEAIERAMRYTIARTGAPGTINTDDLVHACNSLRAQLALQEAASDSHEKLPPLDQQFRDMIAQATGIDPDLLSTVTTNAVRKSMYAAALVDEKTSKVTHRVMPN
jgi:hypothetical protein